jgi:hypothetical protein
MSSRGWAAVPQREPLLSDFTLLARKLEQLGFTYYKGKVAIIDPVKVA